MLRKFAACSLGLSCRGLHGDGSDGHGATGQPVQEGGPNNNIVGGASSTYIRMFTPFWARPDYRGATTLTCSTRNHFFKAEPLNPFQTAKRKNDDINRRLQQKNAHSKIGA